MDGISFRTLQNTALKMINVLRTELVRCIKSMGDFLYLRYILLGTTTKKKKNLRWELLALLACGYRRGVSLRRRCP